MTTDRERIEADMRVLSEAPDGWRAPAWLVLRTVDHCEQLLAALAEAERVVALCAADTTAPDLAQEIEFMKAEHAAALAAAEAENARLREALKGARGAMARAADKIPPNSMAGATSSVLYDARYAIDIALGEAAS